MVTNGPATISDRFPGNGQKWSGEGTVLTVLTVLTVVTVFTVLIIVDHFASLLQEMVGNGQRRYRFDSFHRFDRLTVLTVLTVMHHF